MGPILLVNESSTESEVDARATAEAINHQIRYHFYPAWRLYTICVYWPREQPIPAGASVLHLLDTMDQPGALGYHDEDGNEVAFARVGVQTTLSDHGAVSEVASHEALELLLDPHVNLTAIDPTNSRLYGVEACDACQGNAYDATAPEGSPTGIAVADFVLPSWFDPNTHPDQPTSFRGSVKGPFSVHPKGYTGWLDLKNYAAGWQQSFGAEHVGTVDHDDHFNQRLT